MRRLVILGLSSLGLLGVGIAQTDANTPQPPDPAASPASNLPSFELQRNDRPITVQQTATDAEGGFSITRGGSNCRKDENLSFYYAPNPKRIDTKVNNTRIRSSIVLRTQPKAGGAAAQDKAVLNFFGGSLSVDDETLCPKNLKREKNPKVVITEGRTTVEGGPLVYENNRGVGEMTGPVNLERRASGDSPALTASSARFSFNVDEDVQTLSGNVRIESDGRTSEADTLELDEEAGFAVLRGKPARSRNDEGEVAGEVIEYDLDSNDVVVTQGVRGTFTLDLGNEAPLPSLGGSSQNAGPDSSSAADGTGGDTGAGLDESGPVPDSGAGND